TVLLVLLAVTFCVMTTRVGVYARFGSKGFTLKLVIGVFSLPLGGKPKKPRKKRERRRGLGKGGTEEAEKSKEAKPPKPAWKILEQFDRRKLTRACFRIVDRFLRIPRVDILELRLTVASSEPHKAAVLYGRVCAALGAALPVVNKRLRVRRQKVITGLDFERTRMEAEGRVKITVRVGAAVWFGLWALAVLLRCRKNAKNSERME
ncbi:MAG: hypothetical protein FWH06_08680, partial [Oscillospiraceae bacterium]|nr:hypothetical protein [Oscillospiraceae bacterium]